MADGYLLASFLSPLSNPIPDGAAANHAEGGSPDRAAYPLEVLAAVCQAWPARRSLAIRLVADDRAPGGLTAAAGVAPAPPPAEAGAGPIAVAPGPPAPRAGGATPATLSPPASPPGPARGGGGRGR